MSVGGACLAIGGIRVVTGRGVSVGWACMATESDMGFGKTYRLCSGCTGVILDQACMAMGRYGAWGRCVGCLLVGV